jgi:Mce-associated membrane protein
MSEPETKAVPGPSGPTEGDDVGSGIKVVGTTERTETRTNAGRPPRAVPEAAETGAPDAEAPRVVAPGRPGRGRKGVVALAIVAVLGVAGTVTFWQKWSGLNGRQQASAQASQSARTFLVALTNFDAKSVDRDFSQITAMATGPFARQANQFFNSSIRQQLENALASSRGQVRSLYVQSVGGGQATVYAVVDQLYVNRTLSAPQSDVLRVVVQLSETGGTWKIADVTVLEGPALTSPSPGSTGSSSSG